MRPVPELTDFCLSAYDYHLPPEQIAQHPPAHRGGSRLMLLRKRGMTPEHRQFDELSHILPPASLLVANNSKVFPARVPLSRPTGGKAELLLLTPLALLRPAEARDGFLEAEAEGLLRPAGKIAVGTTLEGKEIMVRALAKGEYGHSKILLRWRGSLEHILAQTGRIPLPPYIKATPGPGELERYQTTYASAPGSVAAPTAGLHFTKAMREELQCQGHEWAEVTLHVGYGTFSPVRCEDIRQHTMHAEYVNIPEETARAINRAKAAGRPVIAVGTTATRTLEGVAGKFGEVRPYAGMINTFLYPGCEFRVIDGLLTNFHLPGSTLLMLVSALAGREKVLAAYGEAVRSGYRFFSFGDAMLIC